MRPRLLLAAPGSTATVASDFGVEEAGFTLQLPSTGTYTVTAAASTSNYTYKTGAYTLELTFGTDSGGGVLAAGSVATGGIDAVGDTD